MKSLKTIWENRQKILEGIKNSIVRDEFVEDVSKLRHDICDSCPSKGNECVMVGTAPCCNECGCSLKFKTRSLSSECPLDKWQAITTEEHEEELDNLKE